MPVKVTLSKNRTTDLQVRINPKSNRISLTVEVNAQSKKPMDENELRGLLLLQLIISAEDKEEFYLRITEELVFEFDSWPDDFDAVMQSQCSEIGFEETSKVIDEVLVAMGNSPLNLKYKA